MLARQSCHMLHNALVGKGAYLVSRICHKQVPDWDGVLVWQLDNLLTECHLQTTPKLPFK